MPTDTERREVARRLREIEQGVIGALIPTGELAENILRAIDYGRSGAMTPYGCLADLIEPSDGGAELCARCDYRDYCDLPECSEQDGYSFKPKGYVDLLVLAYKISETARRDMEICGDTVPSWYAAGRLEAVAHSIREALGVQDA